MNPSLDRTEWRVLAIVWIVLGVHFATNIVREHYPAFSLIEEGSLRVDRYEGFHSDIFVHTDGHAYICNQVGTSMLAALVLFPARPVLDYLEERQLARVDPDATEAKYDSEYPGRVAFYRKAKEQGLELRLGASAAITSAMFMAPLSGVLAVLVLRILRARGVARRRAAGLALLFAMATPVLYRSAILSGNLVLAALTFCAALAAYRAAETPGRVERNWVALSGLLAAFAVLVDYAAVVAWPFLFAYVWASAGTDRVRAAQVFMLASIPGALLLLGTQWVMFGNPFLPAQSHMPVVNFTDRGFRGFDWPSPDLLWQNLASPNYGIATYGPILLLALIPVSDSEERPRIIPRRERLFLWSFCVAFLLFCSANQYARMQWNTGFRYLMPLVPLLFLLASDVLSRLKAPALWLLSVPLLVHSFVLAQTRWTVGTMKAAETGNSVAGSWERFLGAGPDLPWLRVLRETQPADSLLQAPWLASLILGIVALVCLVLWRGVPRDASAR